MIISKQNSLIKQIRSLEDKKNRDKLGVYLAEGTKLVNDAILSGANVEVIVGVKNGLNAIKNLSNGSFRVEEVSEEVFKSITTEVSPQGALAVIKKPELEFSLPKSKSLLLDGVSDPSNVGAIIRTAAASGYKDVYLCETADPFNPKSVNYDDKIHQAIRKYGYDNFKIEIIEVIDNVSNYDLVNERE